MNIICMLNLLKNNCSAVACQCTCVLFTGCHITWFQPSEVMYSIFPLSPCARSEKRPGSEVSFRVPGNICFFCSNGEKIWCWSRIHLLSFSKKCESWLFEGFSVRPNRTWSRRRYVPLAASRRGAVGKMKQWRFRAKQCIWSWCDDQNWKECYQRFLLSQPDTGTCASSSSGRAERKVLVLFNMETPSAQLREESFREPTSLKTASVIAVMPVKSLSILRRQAGKHRKKLLHEVRQDDMYDVCQGLITSLIMICGEDDEDAGDKNTGAIGLELEQSQMSRCVPQWAAHHRSSKDE